MAKDKRSEAREMMQYEEDLGLQIQMLLYKALNRSGMTQAQLAKKMGVTEERIEEILGDDTAFSIRTMADFLYATGYKVSINLER